MSRWLSILATSILVAGCGLGWPSSPLEPPVVDEIFRDPAARVHMTSIDEGGFPDRVVEYHLVVDVVGGSRVEALTGRAQVQSVRGRARAARLTSSMLVVALRDELCVVDLVRAHCFELSADVDPTIAPAVAWRAGDPGARPEERTRAAIALAWIDPAAGLAATDPLGAPTGYTELDAELDGTRARLTGDRALLRTLRDELADASAVRVAGLARACVPALEADVLSQRARMSPSSVALVDEALASCAVRVDRRPTR